MLHGVLHENINSAEKTNAVTEAIILSCMLSDLADDPADRKRQVLKRYTDFLFRVLPASFQARISYELDENDTEVTIRNDIGNCIIGRLTCNIGSPYAFDLYPCENDPQVATLHFPGFPVSLITKTRSRIERRENVSTAEFIDLTLPGGVPFPASKILSIHGPDKTGCITMSILTPAYPFTEAQTRIVAAIRNVA